MSNTSNRLKAAQEGMLKKHAEHHSPKHLKMMRDMMAKGKTFKQAHIAAQKKVGD
tara:strand:- start:45 stop:209 length:165 start_codon:yes stop_codon:yes gene_type:complete